MINTAKIRRRKNVIPPVDTRMLSVQDVVNKYGFHENTIRRWVNRDGLKCLRYGPGNKMFFTKKDLDKFIKKWYSDYGSEK